MSKTFVSAFLFSFVIGGAEAAVVGEDVSYESGGTTFSGYIATDESVSGKRPGVIVVHEWWGQNEYVRERADMLAEMGYTAIALDMYGDGKVADHPDDAGKFAGEVRQNMDVAEARFLAAMELLKQQPNVDPERIAAIGYCFGGGIVLEMARRGVDLDAVASFHGSLGTASPAEAGAIKAKVAVFNGADDPFVKAEQIEAFKGEMDSAGADYVFVNYPGALHSFTNPDADANGEKFSLPLKYDAEADADSWQQTESLLQEAFAK